MDGITACTADISRSPANNSTVFEGVHRLRPLSPGNSCVLQFVHLQERLNKACCTAAPRLPCRRNRSIFAALTLFITATALQNVLLLRLLQDRCSIPAF